MNSINDDSSSNVTIVHELFESIFDKANVIRVQNEEKKQIQDAAIHYALKECEYFICLQLIFHDIEDCKYKLTDEDEEPQCMRNDNMQSYSIAKRKRIQSTNQDELSQPSQQLEQSAINDSQDQLTAQQIMNIMNNKQGFGIFLTPIKDRSYVRSLIAKEKMKNMSYQEVLNNSITYYGKEGLDKKATNLFNKYVQGHSLGPLKIDKSISPLRAQPKELHHPKNVAFQRYYPQDIIEQLDEKVKIENLNLDTRKISLDVSQLDYTKFKLPNQKIEAGNHNIEDNLLHVPTYQSLFQQNIMKYDNSQLTLPTTQITSSQPHIAVHANHLSSIQALSINQHQDEFNNQSSIQSALPVKEKQYVPQYYRKQIQNMYSNSQQSPYSIQPHLQNVQAKIIRASSTIKNNVNLDNNNYSYKNNFKQANRSLDRSSVPILDEKSPIKQNYTYNTYNQNNRRFILDRSFDDIEHHSIAKSQQPQYQQHSQYQSQRHNTSNEALDEQQNSILNDYDEDNEESIMKEKQDTYKKQKVMRKELSQLLLERKKQQKYSTQIKYNNDKSQALMFAPERYISQRNRSQASPLPQKLNNSSNQIKEVLNTSQNYNQKSEYLYQPTILNKPTYNSNHIKQPSYLPPLKTQRLSNQY